MHLSLRQCSRPHLARQPSLQIHWLLHLHLSHQPLPRMVQAPPVPLSEPALPPNAAVSAPLATPTLGPAPSAEAPGAARVGGLAPVGQPASAPKQVASAPGPLPMITPAPGPAAATGNASGGPVAAQRSPSSRPLSTCQTACQAGTHCGLGTPVDS